MLGQVEELCWVKHTRCGFPDLGHRSCLVLLGLLLSGRSSSRCGDWGSSWGSSWGRGWGRHRSGACRRRSSLALSGLRSRSRRRRSGRCLGGLSGARGRLLGGGSRRGLLLLGLLLAKHALEGFLQLVHRIWRCSVVSVHFSIARGKSRRASFLGHTSTETSDVCRE